MIFPSDENEAGDASFDCALISELSFLEELVIEVESPEKWSNQVVGSVIKVVAALKQLTCLQFCFSNEVVDVIQVLASSMRIHVPDMNILVTYVMETSSWRNIQHFQIFQAFIGCEISKHLQPRIPNSYQYTRYVKSCNCLCLGHHTGQGSIKPIRDQVLASVDAYELVNHHSIKKLSDLGIPSMNQMRGCLVENCSELYAALDNVTAPNLEHLYLKNLKKLQTIWGDRARVVSVTHLKTLVLTSCHVLKVVFPFVVIQQLCEIEHLRIEDCPEIVKVLESSAANAGNVDLLPKLRELILLDLANLESICASEFSELPAMEKLKVRKCPALRKLPFRKDDAHKMKMVEAEKEWLDALQ